MSASVLSGSVTRMSSLVTGRALNHTCGNSANAQAFELTQCTLRSVHLSEFTLNDDLHVLSACLASPERFLDLHRRAVSDYSGGIPAGLARQAEKGAKPPYPAKVRRRRQC